MRHGAAGKQLSRNSSHRRAMFRNLVTSLLKYEKVTTTDVKAKLVRPIVEKMITLAKRGDLHARRQALAYLQEKQTAHRLFEEIAKRFTDRQGGYVCITKLGYRKGDGASLSVIQLLQQEEQNVGSAKTKKKAKKKVVTASSEKKIEVSVKAAEKKNKADDPVDQKKEPSDSAVQDTQE